MTIETNEQAAQALLTRFAEWVATSQFTPSHEHTLQAAQAYATLAVADEVRKLRLQHEA